MGVEINWVRQPLTSALHAAEAISRGQPLADDRLAAALEVPARQLAGEIRAAELPAARFWRHLIPLSASVVGRRQLLETAVTKTIGRGPRLESIVGMVGASLSGLEAALSTAFPRLAEELELRERPLREQWEARGNGLLAQVDQLLGEDLMVPRCDVLLVQPALGGGGEAHLAYNSVRFEAVLANPVAELPEIVRLAWLIAQLQLDLPAYSESIQADRLPHIARYALLPATLIAAESVELVRFAPDQLQQAISAWRLVTPKGVDGAALVTEWWETYQQTRPPWNVALAALDQMFG